MDELEVLALSHSYDIIGISETWWDESCGWCVVEFSPNRGKQHLCSPAISHDLASSGHTLSFST